MDDEFHILHLEDDANDGELVVRALQKAGLACRITRVASRAEFQAAFRPDAVDVVISDFSLPGFDGLSALGLVRTQDPDIPFVFVSGTIGEDRAVAALRDGATDYILKDRLSRLPEAIRRCIAERDERDKRRAAEAQIRDQAALLDEAQEAISLHDLDRHVLYWSRGAQRLYGWSAEEAKAGLMSALVPVESEADVDQAWQTALVAGKWDGTLKLVNRHAAPLVVESHWTCLRREDGTPRAILTISTDVTRAHALEQQLLRAQRMETVGMVAGGIAHDLNNVLAPIVIGISSLKRKVTDAHGQKLLNTMEQTVERGAEIVRQVLTFSRGTSSSPGGVNVADVVHDISRLLTATLPRIIRLEIDVPNDLPRVGADATQIQQVLLNLCINARDAMLHGGRLSIRAERAPAQPGRGPDVLIRVVDTGHGIPVEIQRHMFEPFYTTKAHGTGIGLATVASIVNRHGGTIELSSEPDKGTEFRVRLPSLPPKATTAKRTDDAIGSGRGPLLLVLDESSMREMIRQALEAYGYRVTAAADEQEAWQVIDQYRTEIAAVLVNFAVAGLDGAAFVRKLSERSDAVKVISTAGEGPGGMAAVRATLAPPYSAEKLLAAVREVLGA